VALTYALAAATAVFLLTYVLISLRNIGRFPLERPAVAMLGAALMLVLGVLTPTGAIAAINLDVILLLVGMMVLVSGLDVCGFFDFVSLERNALCVLSDSGTVQEECCIFRVPNITIRDVTERPETIECGSNILSGSDPDQIMSIVETVLKARHEWTVPEEYTRVDVSTTVIKILLGYRHGRHS